MTRFQGQSRRLVLVLLGALALSPAAAQSVELGPLLELLAPVPLSTQFVLPNTFGQDIDLRLSAAVYPVPLLLERELNLDIGVNVAYSVGQEPLLVYLGAGPRYSLVGSDWLPGAGAVGSYVGAGAVAGVELGFDFLGVLVEAGGDALFGVTPNTPSLRFAPRVKVGVNLPIIGTMSPL